MSRPVDSPLAGTRQWIRATALAGLLPLAALAGITGGITGGSADRAPNAEVAKAPAVSAATGSDKSARAAAGTYQIRCWQQGRLLFEENQVSLPADSAKYGVKMTGTDRHGKPIYVADTTNATCLIRSVEDDRAAPR